MALRSKLFSGTIELERCAVNDGAHISSGRGEYIRKIQQALKNVGGAGIADDGAFGKLTGDAVFAFKKQWRILGPGQQFPDRIVGRQTIAKLDELQVAFESRQPAPPTPLPVVGMAGVHIGDFRGARIVSDYYTFCGLETIGPARITTSAPSSFGTFEDLIDHLIASTEFHQVIVNHGNATSGLLIPFSAESYYEHTGKIIDSLAGLADILDTDGSIDETDPNAAGFLLIRNVLGVTYSVVIRVAGKLSRLRKKPAIYHFRACNLKTASMVSDYKWAFGALGISYHGCRLFYLRIIPAPAKPGLSLLNLNFPVSSRHRYRVTIDLDQKLHPIFMEIRDLDGHTHVRDSTIMQERTAAEIAGWAKIWIDRWKISDAFQFVIPVMWEDAETTFHYPLELGWRAKLAFV